jgi:hypothetical protein
MVDFLFVVAVVSLAVLFFWAILAPRRFWRILIGWSYRDPSRNEPSAAVFGLYRTVAFVGIVALVSTGVAINQPASDPPEQASAPPSAVQRMWGSPAPLVVDRVVVPHSEPPIGLVRQPLLGFQPVEGARRLPGYLFGLRVFERDDAVEANGLMGVPPPPGLVALDTADLVLHVNADRRCFPHEVVVNESAKSVRVGIFFGQANPRDGSNAARVAECDPEPERAGVSLLVPVTLSDALGDREVQDLDGRPVRRVEVLER